MPPDCYLPEALVAGAPSTGWQVGKEEFLWEDNAQTLLQVTPRGVLGRGRTAEVEEVVVPGSVTALARKRVFIARINAPSALEKTGLRAEIDILRNSSHHHIVKVIGCYQEPVGLYSANFFVLLYPSADCDLHIFLEEKCRNSCRITRKKYVWYIKKWFLCLASALAYLHYHGIHHEDIKPANIVHRGKVVYFTDFSSSRKIASGDETSTESPATATRLFAAPEAMYEDGRMLRHGSKTDVYSLGLVFIEMLTVITGRGIDDLREYVFGDTIGMRQYHRVIHKLVAWFRDSTDSKRLSSIVLSAMLKHERKDRLSAQGVADRVRNLRDFYQSDACGCKWIRWERAEDIIDNHNFTNTDEDGEFVIV
ncbi:kinase-like domain-containing protein [Paraphoma chrysanthemicola]|uniref:Kinase-like domain-containing protein n=1 Tax=Paraphoma chrysanthemicola TaxID=798071 RepID=A0A8K0W2Q1_9PLEO|nr:kinase-like domain-containing protein [Paraphoma chrysanthemicola]